MFNLPNCISIEVYTSFLLELLLKNNCIFRHLKVKHDHSIERVDTKRPGDGGYGFSYEWLEIFEILTYFYVYQRISKNDLLYFVDAIRYNIIHDEIKVNTVEFLKDSSKKTKKINEGIFDNFRKYNLMDILQRILEYKMYLPNSYLDTHQKDAIVENSKRL